MQFKRINAYPNITCMIKKYLKDTVSIQNALEGFRIFKSSAIVLFLFSFSMICAPDAQAQRYVDDSSNDGFEWTAPESPTDGSTPPTPPSPPGDGPTQTPIDGGLGLLLVAGGAYAARKLRKDASKTVV